MQMAVMILFAVVFVDFVWHFYKRQPVKPFRFRKTGSVTPFVPTDSMSPAVMKKVKLFLAAITFSWTCVLVRSIYRDVELLDGVGPFFFPGAAQHEQLIENSPLLSRVCVLLTSGPAESSRRKPTSTSSTR